MIMKFRARMMGAFLSLLFCVAATAADVDRLATELYPLILSGQAQQLESSFAVEPKIDTPRTGPLRGVQMWRRFVAQESQWLTGMGVRPESLKVVKTTRNAQRVVHEFVVDVATSARTGPFKMAVVVDATGNKAAAVRVYYAYATTPGNQGFLRQAIIPSDPNVVKEVATPVRKYFEAIEASDQMAWKYFTPDGYFNGGNAPLTGFGLKKFYAVLGAEPGGVPLRPATVTCEHGTCAIEENLATWGTIVFSRDTAGLAVYDYDEARGLVMGARVYDDLPESPFGVPGWIHKNWSLIASALEKSGCKTTYRPASDASPATVRRELFGAHCE
ncbi:hypothetical protein [Variovorax sp. YR566]|uniref:hypothetical protein n=1 Tax=Variovorax sp. YR566 TaxID=3450237 RepID=UPI003F810AAC